MRKLTYLLSILFIAALSIAAWFFISLNIAAEIESSSFVKAIQEGNLGKVVKYFGGRTCHCPIPQGWGTYLVYQSGQEPNLAFLVGHELKFGKPNLITVNRLPAQLFAWQKPQSLVINVPIQFTDHYMPLFIPLPMACGKDMSKKEVEAFIDDPTIGTWRGFTLRLRPSLKPGSIKAHLETFDPQSLEKLNSFFNRSDPHFINKSTTLKEKLLSAALANKHIEIVQPFKEAGIVKDENGQVVSTKILEQDLPKLKSATLSLEFIRNSLFDNWHISRFTVIQPIIVEKNGSKVINLTEAFAQSYEKNQTNTSQKE